MLFPMNSGMCNSSASWLEELLLLGRRVLPKAGLCKLWSERFLESLCKVWWENLPGYSVKSSCMDARITQTGTIHQSSHWWCRGWCRGMFLCTGLILPGVAKCLCIVYYGLISMLPKAIAPKGSTYTFSICQTEILCWYFSFADIFHLPNWELFYER